jgi:DNA mismatch endonuclease (patch repair protein)
MALRRALHAAGARFRLQRRVAPGVTADLVLPRHKIAVFVDGCWWHSCPDHGRKAPWTGPNASLWEKKMARTRERDAQAVELAANLGWLAVRLWECEVLTDPPTMAALLLAMRPNPER